MSAARRAQSTGCAAHEPDPPLPVPKAEEKPEKEDGLRPPRLPSAKAQDELLAFGPAQWLTVQQCGWKGPQCLDGSRCDLLPELLAQEGMPYVKDEYFYYLPCDGPRQPLVEQLQQVVQALDRARRRGDHECRKRFKGERPRLVANFQLFRWPMVDRN